MSHYKKRWIDSIFVFAFQPHRISVARGHLARVRDRKSTLWKHCGLDRRSPWPPMTPSASQGLRAVPMVCRETVMCSVCGPEGRGRPPGVRSHPHLHLPEPPDDEDPGADMWGATRNSRDQHLLSTPQRELVSPNPPLPAGLKGR